jgi:glycosyltransferase involved in cell wall biosynthesis
MSYLQPEKTDRLLVSFIVTCYDLPTDLLRECIESIRRLSLPASEREIILVDDGSAHSPLPALAALADEVIYVRQSNQGLSVARNTGLQMARGIYLQFVDGDDMLLRAPYEHCLELVHKNDLDMVLFGFTRDRKDEPTAKYGETPAETGIAYMRQHNLHGSACCYLFRSSLLGELRFTPSIYHEDEEFTPQLMLRAERVCATTAVPYYYRQRENSIITTVDEALVQRKRDDIKGIILRLQTMADRLPTQERLAMQRRVAQLTMDYLYSLIVQTRSYDVVSAQVEELRAKGLFPLPSHDYTVKYKWFRLMSSTTMGLKMLIYTLPLMRKER